MAKVEAAIRLALTATERWNARDAAGIAELLSDDALFEWPVAGGTVSRARGKTAILNALEDSFRAGTAPAVSPVDSFGTPLRAAVRWETEGAEGVDLYQVRNERIVERVSYVNGKGAIA